MDYKEFIGKFNITLNEQQSLAVQATDGAVLLLAVPGSGKTTVLVARLGYMILCRNIDPRSILTMTYTVAATNDMRSRFSSFFGDEYGSLLEFRTINGVCARIIRTYEQLSGSRAFDVISNEKEVSALLASVYREVMEDFPTESDIKGIRSLITYAKNMMLTDEEIKSLDNEQHGFSEMYAKYCGALRQRRLMDYDDQMVYALRMLERYPQILERIHAKYKYICVDEAQDTSKIQHKIISLLAKGSGNIFMVGDEDQSIYGFRAAYPQALMSFEKEYKNARVLLMEENFRSVSKVVGAADKFISKSTNRHKKNMRAARSEAGILRRHALISKHSQYSYLLKVARECEGETAILYRDNESALPLIDLFERNGITYKIRSGDMTFFSHRVVSDIRYIIRLAYDPYDTDAFIQVYYKISTYLNKAAATAVCTVSRNEAVSVWDALFMAEDISPAALKSCRTLKTHFDQLPKDHADRAVSRIFNSMSYCDYLERIGIKTEKIFILSAIGSNEVSPSGLLRRLDELESIVKAGGSASEYKVILSTIHSSKGLEYDTVFLIDVCDGMFPEIVADNPKYYDEEDVRTYEEERRLFYVGITRAKNKLIVLTYADEPSSFAEELLKAASSDNPAVVSASFTVGREIIHKVFGKGTVVSAKDDIITVSFESGDVKKLSCKALVSKDLLK